MRNASATRPRSTRPSALTKLAARPQRPCASLPFLICIGSLETGPPTAPLRAKRRRDPPELACTLLMSVSLIRYRDNVWDISRVNSRSITHVLTLGDQPGLRTDAQRRERLPHRPKPQSARSCQDLCHDFFLIDEGFALES